MQDYKTEQERNAYCAGVIAHINGLTLTDCPYQRTFTGVFNTILYFAWVRGYNEKGLVKK